MHQSTFHIKKIPSDFIFVHTAQSVLPLRQRPVHDCHISIYVCLYLGHNYGIHLPRISIMSTKHSC